MFGKQRNLAVSFNMLCLQRRYKKSILFNQAGECPYGSIKFW